MTRRPLPVIQVGMRRYRMRDPKYPQPTEPHWLVAVDLGKVKVGVAVFWVTDVARLHWAGTVIARRGSTPDTVASTVLAAANAHALSSRPPSQQAWVCEWPEKYKASPKYHKDLDSLWEVGFALRRLVGKWSEKYAPKEWKASVPKAAHHRRILKELHDLEKPKLADRGHDTLDAVGIGLFASARHQRGGV